MIDLLSAFNNHNNLHKKDTDMGIAMKTLHHRQGLKRFLSGLKEPLGGIIRAMKLKTLAEVYTYFVCEENISYGRKSPFNSIGNTPTTDKPLMQSNLPKQHNF